MATGEHLTSQQQYSSNNNDGGSSHLIRLNLNYRNIQVIDQVHLRFCSLRELYLNHNQLKSLKGIEQFAYLEELHLKFNCISQMAEIDRIVSRASLKVLNLKGNPVEKFPDCAFSTLLHFFPNLIELNEQSNPYASSFSQRSKQTVGVPIGSSGIPKPPQLQSQHSLQKLHEQQNYQQHEMQQQRQQQQQQGFRSTSKTNFNSNSMLSNGQQTTQRLLSNATKLSEYLGSTLSSTNMDQHSINSKSTSRKPNTNQSTGLSSMLGNPQISFSARSEYQQQQRSTSIQVPSDAVLGTKASFGKNLSNSLSKLKHDAKENLFNQVNVQKPTQSNLKRESSFHQFTTSSSSMTSAAEVIKRTDSLLNQTKNKKGVILPGTQSTSNLGIVSMLPQPAGKSSSIQQHSKQSQQQQMQPFSFAKPPTNMNSASSSNWNSIDQRAIGETIITAVAPAPLQNLSYGKSQQKMRSASFFDSNRVALSDQTNSACSEIVPELKQEKNTQNIGNLSSRGTCEPNSGSLMSSRSNSSLAQASNSSMHNISRNSSANHNNNNHNSNTSSNVQTNNRYASNPQHTATFAQQCQIQKQLSKQKGEAMFCFDTHNSQNSNEGQNIQQQGEPNYLSKPTQQINNNPINNNNSNNNIYINNNNLNNNPTRIDTQYNPLDTDLSFDALNLRGSVSLPSKNRRRAFSNTGGTNPQNGGGITQQSVNQSSSNIPCNNNSSNIANNIIQVNQSNNIPGLEMTSLNLSRISHINGKSLLNISIPQNWKSDYSPFRLSTEDVVRSSTSYPNPIQGNQRKSIIVSDIVFKQAPQSAITVGTSTISNDQMMNQTNNFNNNTIDEVSVSGNNRSVINQHIDNIDSDIEALAKVLYEKSLKEKAFKSLFYLKAFNNVEKITANPNVQQPQLKIEVNSQQQQSNLYLQNPKNYQQKQNQSAILVDGAVSFCEVDSKDEMLITHNNISQDTSMIMLHQMQIQQQQQLNKQLKSGSEMSQIPKSQLQNINEQIDKGGNHEMSFKFVEKQQPQYNNQIKEQQFKVYAGQGNSQENYNEEQIGSSDPFEKRTTDNNLNRTFDDDLEEIDFIDDEKAYFAEEFRRKYLKTRTFYGWKVVAINEKLHAKMYASLSNIKKGVIAMHSARGDYNRNEAHISQQTLSRHQPPQSQMHFLQSQQNSATSLSSNRKDSFQRRAASSHEIKEIWQGQNQGELVVPSCMSEFPHRKGSIQLTGQNQLITLNPQNNYKQQSYGQENEGQRILNDVTNVQQLHFKEGKNYNLPLSTGNSFPFKSNSIEGRSKRC